MKAFVVSLGTLPLNGSGFTQNFSRSRLRQAESVHVARSVRVGCARVCMTSAVQSAAPPAMSEDVPRGPMYKLEYTRVSNPWKRFLRTMRFLFAIRSRVKKGSVLCMTVGGSVADRRPMRSPFAPPSETLSLPEITDNLRHAAHDPRVAAVYMKIDPLTCGYAKLEEVRRHMDYFRQSGKKVIAYMQLGREKEYFLSLSADETYAPEEAFFSLRGFRVSGSFLRGVFNKIGVEPQVQRIGIYKSAGDQFARDNMSDAQRFVLDSLLKQQYRRFVEDVAEAKDKTQADVEALINSAPQKMSEYVDGGWITGLKYESEVIDMLKDQYNSGKDTEAKLKRPLKAVNTRKYARVKAKTLGLQGKSAIAVIRTSGVISLGKDSSNAVTGSVAGSDSFVELIRTAFMADYIKAVVLRIDSPGGVSLAADVMWKEIRRLAEKKPVIASMADVAASGGYYMAMGCDKIVAEDTTITGSIGVVTTKLSLKGLYERIGFVKENLSVGPYAEVDVDDRPFTPAESSYFEDGAVTAYKNFVSKAAECRGKDYDSLHAVAQGRVWTGRQAKKLGLVDELGGLDLAVQLAKEKAEIKDAGRLVELRSRKGLPAILGLLRSDSSTIAPLISDLGKPEVLAMTEIDGSGGNPVLQHLLSRILQGIPSNLLDQLVSSGLFQVFQGR